MGAAQPGFPAPQPHYLGPQPRHVVVEAARRSGSLVIARFANEQGREVFAVPGSPLDMRAEQTNDPLRKGASLCARLEDVIDALGSGDPKPVGGLFDDDTAGEESLFDERDLFPGSRRRGVRGQRLGQGSAAMRRPMTRRRRRSPAPARVLVPSLLGPALAPVDTLIRMAGPHARDVQGALAELDLDGRLECRGSNAVSLFLK